MKPDEDAILHISGDIRGLEIQERHWLETITNGPPHMKGHPDHVQTVRTRVETYALFDAAPDMYRALEELVRMVGDEEIFVESLSNSTPDVLEMAVAALKKARGGL